MPTFTNIRGTSEQHFRISLSGPTIYHGTAVPSATPPTSLDGGPLNPGDIYIRTDPANTGLFVLGSGGDNDWNEFLETGGGAAIIGGDLNVQGDLDTWGDIILLNSDLSALVGNIGGMEIGRNAAPNARWVWNDALTQWEAASNPDTPNLHNVFIENNLEVGGILTAPDGLAVTPGIRFSTAGTGIYATATTIGFSTGGTSKWLIDSSNNFIPSGAYDIGATGALAGNIYGTRFLSADGSSLIPAFSFDSEPDTGMYLSGTGPATLGLSADGAKIFTVTPTNATLLGVLQIADVLDTTRWSLTNDPSDADKLKITNSGGAGSLDITTDGYVLASDGVQANPAYSFISNPDSGMYFDGVADTINFTLPVGIPDRLIISETYIRAPGATVSDPQDLTTKAYVDGITGGSWREPVVVKEDIPYANITAALAALNTAGLVDGVAMTTGDRILYSALTTGNDNVYIVGGPSFPNFTLTEDGAGPGFGDTVYVNDGTNNGKIFSYDLAGIWTGVSGTGGGGTMYFDYEVQTAIALQTVFTLATAKYAPTPDGSRLQVYVNGVKQVFGALNAYVETDEITVTFNVAPGVGKIVEFYAVGLATNDGILIRETQTGLPPTPVITFNVITYVPGQAGLLVYLNGQKMVLGTAYTEINSTSIQWVSPALVNADVLEFYSSAPIIAGVNLEDLGNVSGAPAPLADYELRYNTGFGVWEPRAPGTSQTGLLHDDETTLVGVIDGVNAVFTTVNSAVAPKLGGRSFQQVFVNGVLQREGGPGDYVPTTPNIITFNIGSIPTPGDTIDVYQL